MGNRGHPAVMSAAIMDACKFFLPDKRCRVLDPFAGVGTTALLLPEHDVIGIEIEKEWADCHEGTICGDSKEIIPTLGKFDVVLTSPTYGNRMADDFKASTPTGRITYRHKLGRELSKGTTSNLYFGKKNKKYETLHLDIWEKCVNALVHKGLFILNCKDFIASGEIKEVSRWHVDTLQSLGLEMVGHRKVEQRGMRYGSNCNARVSHENVYCFQKL